MTWEHSPIRSSATVTCVATAETTGDACITQCGTGPEMQLQLIGLSATRVADP